MTDAHTLQASASAALARIRASGAIAPPDLAAVVAAASSRQKALQAVFCPALGRLAVEHHAAADAIADMACAKSAAVRQCAILSLRASQSPAWTLPVVARLLNDPAAPVRQRMVGACLALRWPELVPVLEATATNRAVSGAAAERAKVAEVLALVRDGHVYVPDAKGGGWLTLLRGASLRSQYVSAAEIEARGLAALAQTLGASKRAPD